MLHHSLLKCTKTIVMLTKMRTPLMINASPAE